MIDGHQKTDSWANEYGKDLVVNVARADRAFSEQDKQEFTLLFHQAAFGQWNLDELVNNFDPVQLATFGFDQDALSQTRAEMAFLIEMLGDGFTEGEGENDPYEEWEGMPEFENEDKTSYQSIHVHFKNKEEVEEFAKLLGQSLTEKTRSIWFSQREQMLDGRERYTS